MEKVCICGKKFTFVKSSIFAICPACVDEYLGYMIRNHELRKIHLIKDPMEEGFLDDECIPPIT